MVLPMSEPRRRFLTPMVGRSSDERFRVSTPLELFFDLCFVVAVSQAAAPLHHSIAEHQVRHGLTGYLMVFFAIWWAWMNFTWFASAYDNDDVLYRLVTLVEITGALILAAGIPEAFSAADFTTVFVGYLVLRLGLVIQWLRAAHDDPPGRGADRRYAAGVSMCMVGWFVVLLLGWPLWGWFVMAAMELTVPLWAERGATTAWHPGHIAERYGEFTIIVLGEVVAAIATAMQEAVDHSRPSPGLITAAAAGLLLVFALWWLYFKHSATEEIRQSLRWTFVWAFAHYLIFAAVAALGAGLQVVIGTLTHSTRVTPSFAAFTVAIPVTIYIVVLAQLSTRGSGEASARQLTLLTGALILAAAAATPILTLPFSIVIMVVLVALLLAYHLTAAHRATHQP